MRRPVFSFRPNMDNPEHRQAWEILRSVPEGQKNQFVVSAILKSKERVRWDTRICTRYTGNHDAGIRRAGDRSYAGK